MLQHCTEFDRPLATHADPVARRGVHAACEFAANAHAGQTRRSGEPFITHPLSVASLVMSWRMDAKSVITALLHDVLEDTDVTPATLENNFGKSVCTMVQALTKPQRDSGGVTGIHAPSHALAQLRCAAGLGRERYGAEHLPARAGQAQVRHLAIPGPQQLAVDPEYQQLDFG